MALSAPPSWRRRSVLGSLASWPLLAALPAAAAENSPLRLGQSTALTGPLGDLGQAMHLGALSYFGAVNASGGVHGRKIELVTKDDGYETQRAVANMQELMADKSLLALFNCFGTPATEAIMPKVLESGMPFFAPLTGALLARPKARNALNIRASYADEAEQQVQHLATVGTRRIAIAYQNNAFGKEVFEGARLAMEKHKIPAPKALTVENDGSDAAKTAAALAAAEPEAVLVGLAGKPASEFIKAMRQQRRGLPLYALSVMGSAATLKALGDDATGIAISQVVPMPTNAVVPVVRDFQQAWKAAGAKLEPSHLALEGYINARVFTEALRRAGPNPTRATFLDAIWGLRRYDLGGFEIGFTEPGRNASRFVELTLVGRDGRFLR